MLHEDSYELVAKTFYGLEKVLADEVLKIGGENVRVLNRAVSFKGDKKLLYKANLHLRTAVSILQPVGTFQAPNQDVLYNNTFKIPWEEYLSTSDSFAVYANVFFHKFKHSGFVALKVKDAIADRFRQKYNKRPDINTDSPSVKIQVHVNSMGTATILLDSSGEPLYKRGYRVASGKSPLNEVLAAGLVLLSGWDAKIPLIDPMCGSGTILIEAGLYAMNIPPGIFRRRFGFESWKNFDEELLTDLYNQEMEPLCSRPKLIARDKKKEVLQFARDNSKSAGLGKHVIIENIEFTDSKPRVEYGIIIMNPPYGERLSNVGLLDLYARVGSTLKHNYSGFSAWILSSNFEALKKIALKPIIKHKIYNGNLESAYNRYDLYEGSRKENVKKKLTH